MYMNQNRETGKPNGYPLKDVQAELFAQFHNLTIEQLANFVHSHAIFVNNDGNTGRLVKVHRAVQGGEKMVEVIISGKTEQWPISAVTYSWAKNRATGTESVKPE